MCDCENKCQQCKDLHDTQYRREYERIWKNRILDVLIIGTMGYLVYKVITYTPSGPLFTITITDPQGTITYRM